MATPHEVFREVFSSTGDRIAAIRIIRERFGLDLKQAKEVMLQAEGTASSLDEHLDRIADTLEEVFKKSNEGKCSPDGASGNSQG